MTPFDFEFLRRLLKERSGLMLTPEKGYLVESRLLPVVRRTGCASFSELVQHLKRPENEELRVAVTEAMMNHESFFFRDKIPFDRFSDTVLPDLLQRRAKSRRLSIWSAAASTGQEAYSMAMALEALGLQDWHVSIVATDICGEALEKAQRGLYSQFEVQRGLPIQMLMQHFAQEGDQWRISERIRSMVRFRKVNLIENFSFLGLFDVIFCRNVLIYFDQPTKMQVLAGLRQSLASDGYLVLGAAETVVGLGELFVPVSEKRGLYQPARQEMNRRGLAVVEGTQVA